MPKPTESARRILKVSCTYGAMPAGDWSSRATLFARGSTLWAEQTCDDHVRRRRLRWGRPFWRTFAAYLSREISDWAIPAQAVSSVLVSGIHGWRAELLAVSWARFGEEKELNPGAVLLAFPDRWLRALSATHGSLASFVEATWGDSRPQWLEAGGVAVGKRRNLGPALYSLARALGLGSTGDPISRLIQLMEGRTSAFNALEQHVSGIAAARVGPLPSGTGKEGYFAALKYASTIEAIVRASRRTYLRTGRLPPNYRMKLARLRPSVF